MQPNQTDLNDQKQFSELLRDCNFDDSIGQDHRSELRDCFLQACDHSQINENSRAPIELQANGEVRSSAKSIIVLSASVAACLLGIIGFWLTNDRQRGARPNAVTEAVTGIKVDPTLVAAITEADAHQDEHSVNAFFDALASCEQDHDARLFEHSRIQMHCIDETSISNLTPKRPQG